MPHQRTLTPREKVKVVQVTEQMILQDVWQMNRPDCKEKKTKQPGEARVQMEEVMGLMAVVVQRMVVVMERMAMEDLAEMEEMDVEEMRQGSMDKEALEDLTEVEGTDLEEMRQGNTDKEETVKMEVGRVERILEWVWEQTDWEASQLWLDLVEMVQVC